MGLYGGQVLADAIRVFLKRLAERDEWKPDEVRRLLLRCLLEELAEEPESEEE